MLTISHNESTKSSWVTKYLDRNNTREKPSICIDSNLFFLECIQALVIPYRMTLQQNPQDTLTNLVVVWHNLLQHQSRPSNNPYIWPKNRQIKQMIVKCWKSSKVWTCSRKLMINTINAKKSKFQITYITMTIQREHLNFFYMHQNMICR